jgi:hypothetical protein
MSQALIDQARETNTFRISENPYTLTISQYQTKVDAYGKSIPDYSKPKVDTVIGDVRIVVKSNTLPTPDENGTPVSISREFYIITEYNASISQGMEFLYNGRQFKIEEPESVIKWGAVIYKRAELTQLDRGE